MVYLAWVDCQTLEDYVHAISGYSGSAGMDALPGLDGLSAAMGALPGLDGLSAAKGSCMSFQVILGLQVWMLYLAWMDIQTLKDYMFVVLGHPGSVVLGGQLGLDGWTGRH